MIPLNDLGRQHATIDHHLLGAIEQVLASGRFIGSARVLSFEAAFSEYCGTSHCIGVANGTDALELALRAVGVARGHRVVTVANAGGYASTATCAIGAIPVYVDIESRTLLADARLLKDLPDPIAAIVVTHLYGRMADMGAILRWAKPRGIPVVEDCAQAHGAKRDGKRAGAHGTVGCFSFYPTKNLGALGDGGAVVTGDAAIAARVRALRQYGWSSKYHADLRGGRNSRLDELQAAVLLAKLPHVDRWNERRRAIAARYRKGLDNPRIHPPPDGGGEHVTHLLVVRVEGRASLCADLSAQAIGHDVHYPVPDHRQPAFDCGGKVVSLPVTERATDEILSLPCFPEMTDDEVDQVVAVCNAWRG
jgi:dTDP-3-amino-2,3,6-trideoxy-4-keto-D-glucose/dTDP-3-amino-3,4,6-trideoxy-alpha-D-glucose/dTDP-2,6-dideoxy-D-kanosamine transaminase